MTTVSNHGQNNIVGGRVDIMPEARGTNRTCRCRNPKEEMVDITPVGWRNKRYFKRCRRCGVVLSVCCPERGFMEKSLGWMLNK